ncbi:MAG: hypothetical protein ACFFAO_13575 [Candidatus Hermodarchaeota archaeon]
MNKTIIYLFVTFLCCFLFLSLNSNSVMAHDGDDDGVDDDLEDLNERNISIEFEDNEIEIETILRSGDIVDEIEFTLSNSSDGFTIKTEYDREISSGEFELNFEISFLSIIEYNDTNEDGVYNSSHGDTIVKEIKLDNFQPTIYQNISLSQDNNLYHFIINTTDGNFTAHIFIGEEFCKVNGTILTPAQIKIDIEISNFPYNEIDSLLALNTTLKSESEYEEEEKTEDEYRGYSENEGWLLTKMNETTGYFSWNKSVNVDGKIKDVIIGNKTDIGEFERIFINYPNGTHIYHDPKMGVAWILKPLPLGQDNEDSDGNKVEKTPFLNIIYILATILIIGASIAASSIYYRHRKNSLPTIFNDEKRKKTYSLNKQVKSSGDILKESRIKGELLQIFEGDNMIENLSQLNDIDITSISGDFLYEIDQFDWEDNDKVEFIKEMLALTPKERSDILEQMKEKKSKSS